MSIFSIIYQILKKDTLYELSFEGTMNLANATDDITFDHVIRRQIENVIKQISQRLQSLKVVGINEILPFLHVT